MFNKRVHIAVAVLMIGLTLTGCSGGVVITSTQETLTADSGAVTGAAGTDESKAGACAIVASTLQELSKVGSEVDPMNPQATLDQFTELSKASGEALRSITHPEVAPAAAEAASGVNDYATYLTSVVNDPSQVSRLGEEASAFIESLTPVGTLCAQ